MLMGTCHCGSAQWTLEGDPGAITACNCTLCCRYGALWAYDEDDERGRTTISGATRPMELTLPKTLEGASWVGLESSLRFGT
jgi:hypothetical protein